MSECHKVFKKFWKRLFAAAVWKFLHGSVITIEINALTITRPESGSGGSDGSSCDNGVACHQKHKHNSSAAIDCCACPGIVVSKSIIAKCKIN